MNNQNGTKFCKYCGVQINEGTVICTSCGKQIVDIQESANSQPQVISNNTNINTNVNRNINNTYIGNAKNKWVALILCFFFGWLGAHKFYEGKVGMGLLYLFTMGFFGLGVFIDFIVLLFKPTTYYR